MHKNKGANVKNIILILLLFSSDFAVAQTQAVWQPQWQFDPMDDSVTCSVFSNEISFDSRYLTNHAYIGVQEDNAVTIHTKKNTFDSNYISKFGIRAGKNKAILYPKYISTHLVKFSPEKSKKIIEELVTSTSFTLQVSFFPESRVVNREAHIGKDFTTFQAAMASKNNCVAIKNNNGWVGVGLQDMNAEPTYLKFIKENTDYSNPGVMIWSVHPKKAGSKSGLLNFDIILAVNNKPVELKTLLNKLTQLQSGDTAELYILRGNGFKYIKLTKPE